MLDLPPVAEDSGPISTKVTHYACGHPAQSLSPLLPDLATMQSPQEHRIDLEQTASDLWQR
jgi:hypothetical protein